MIDSVLLAEITAQQRERELGADGRHRAEALARRQAQPHAVRAAVASLLMRVAVWLDERAGDRAFAPGVK
jgi:hypothetical protein